MQRIRDEDERLNTDIDLGKFVETIEPSVAAFL
jgi:hypothetical protein